ncbi:MAG: SSU ribosomal protein S6p, partial [uncultured Quadrisphaera sp.]
ASLRAHGHPRRRPRGAHRRPVARQVPQRRPPGRWLRRQGRHLGPSPPGLRHRQEVRGHLRGGRPDRHARRRAGARPPAGAQRVRAAHQAHAPGRAL